LNPAYAGYLPATAAALAPVLTEVAGLPGAPARVSQAAATYRQGVGNSVSIGLAGPAISGSPPAFPLPPLHPLPPPPPTPRPPARRHHAPRPPGRGAATKRRARPRGRRHRRRPQPIAGPAGGHGGAADGGRPAGARAPARHPAGARRARDGAARAGSWLAGV